MMIFEHTHRERGMWRGWIKNGQVLELRWSRRSFEIGAGVLVHSDESDFGRRMLPGIAMDQTYVGGVPDFSGDTHASTFHAGGPGKIIECMKCENCGWSVT